MARRYAALRGRGYPYLVAELDGAVAGYAYAGPYRARPAYDWCVEDSIYVAPECARRGLGRALLAQLIADAQAKGFRQMIAVIGDSANFASVELHRALGFRIVGTFDNVGFKFGRWLDSVLMQRSMGKGADTAPERRC
jgi:phosphinothricin acetyltransferase